MENTEPKGFDFHSGGLMLAVEDAKNFKRVFDDLNIDVELEPTNKYGNKSNTTSIWLTGNTVEENLAIFEALSNGINEIAKYGNDDLKASGERARGQISEKIGAINTEIAKYSDTYKESVEGMAKYDDRFLNEYKAILSARTELEEAHLKGNKDAVKESTDRLIESLKAGVKKQPEQMRVR